MNYQQATDLIRSHTDYGGSVDVHALAVAMSAQAVGAALTLDQWIDIASRHANRDWNGGGYLESVQAVCADYARKGVDRLTEARIDWIANAHCPGGIAYPSNVKNAIREALRESSSATASDKEGA